MNTATETWRSDLAGAWYDGDPAVLKRTVRAWLAEAAADDASALPSPPRALILPHAGYAYSGRVAARGIARLSGQAIRRVLVLGPTHRTRLRNRVSVPDAACFETILGAVPMDTELAEWLLEDPHFTVAPEAQPGEHSVEIEVPLLQTALAGFRLTLLVVGQLDAAAARAVARRLRPALDADTLLVVSTDFTHYGARFGYLPFTDRVEERLRALDLGAFDRILRRDAAGFRRYLDETGATICGRDPLGVLLELMGPAQTAHLLDYETSGQVTGDWRQVVSYVAAAVCGPWPEERRSALGEAT